MVKRAKHKVMVAMSGGVDSSAAAFMLKKNHDVTGLFMRLGASGEDRAERAARAVCCKIKIPFYPVKLADDFQKRIIAHFLESYQKGLTPNPCVRCNSLIKFGELFKTARSLGADFLATGHYARLRREYTISNIQYPIKLFKAKDNNKDQVYFLYTLTQGQLKKIIFPLGEYKKEEVRKIVDRAGLPYVKSESQDVCFLKEDGRIIEHNEFIKKHLKLKPGPIVALTRRPSPAGKRGFIGEHQGLPLYTIGQRKGIEIGGTGPYYAAGLDHEKNILYVVSDFNDPALFKSELIAREVNWIAGHEPKMPLRCQAVIRYRHKAVKCEVRSKKLEVRSKKSEVRSKKSNEYFVKFEEAQRAVTPGQSVVFYDGDEVLGGGTIEVRS